MTADDQSEAMQAWQHAKYTFDDYSGEQEIFGGFVQFFDEQYGEIWVEASGQGKKAKRLRHKLKALMKGGADPLRAAEMASPMGKKVTFADLE